MYTLRHATVVQYGLSELPLKHHCLELNHWMLSYYNSTNTIRMYCNLRLSWPISLSQAVHLILLYVFPTSLFSVNTHTHTHTHTNKHTHTRTHARAHTNTHTKALRKRKKNKELLYYCDLLEWQPVRQLSNYILP